MIILRESPISINDGLLIDESVEEDTCHHSIILTCPFSLFTITFSPMRECLREYGAIISAH